MRVTVQRHDLQEVVGSGRNTRPEPAAGVLDGRAQPFGVGLGGSLESHLPHAQRNHLQRNQFTANRIGTGQIQQSEVGAERLVPADAFVVVDDVTAAVQDRFAAIYLDRPGMVRGVSVNDVDAHVDQPVRERGLACCYRITPNWLPNAPRRW